MKNQMLVKLARVLFLIPCLIFLVNCSKSSKGNNNNQCVQPTQYGQQPYGQPYQQPYNANCGYGNYPPGTGGQQQYCQGVYWYQGQAVWCEAQACKGWTLQVNTAGPQAQPSAPGQSVVCM